ncbi:MFS transporter [Streptomyces venezuelae]|uniref:MFS transporter n=1 Tax=Streptomyces venezuelae TaxID=54571 RepID=A0A5P2DV42_STRVZ|nr:MFS transporter [Streptomyces venezuelae]QES58783.1 MFS transporter [Streptomyces venezuelae]
MPKAVYVLALGIFAMVTSEFVVAGLMPQISEGLGATIPQVGYLITAFAVAMALGGPFLATAVLRLPHKSALMVLFAVFLGGNVLAALSTDYVTMAVGRVITGVASSAFFGVSLSVVAEITKPEMRGKAIGAAMNGLMLGTLLGLPISTFVGGQFGWRAAFWAISGLTVLAAVATIVGVPSVTGAEGGGGPSVREEMRAFRNPRLWLVFSTSTLIIGATFSAFSYFTPILTELTGFSEGSVPWLLVAYGAATVVGNNIVGRFADKHTIVTQLVGLGLNMVFLAGFAVFAEVTAPALVFMMGIGLVGVTMNPCMITRVQRTANARPLVNTVHSSFITLGIVIGSWLGGVGINAYGLRAPLVLGVIMAFLGLFTLLPDLRAKKDGSGGTTAAAPDRQPATA